RVGGGAMYADLMTKIVKTSMALGPPKTNANAYVELGFASGTPSLAPGEEPAFVDWQIHDSNNYSQHYNQSNDYSFDATKTSATVWDHVTLYRNGTTLLWGVAPP